MPVARIFSRHPEHTIALSHDLERQGYRVEVLSPEDIPSTPADLEIQYEVCDSETALQRARELASRMQADVAVASGALRFEPQPTAVETLPNSQPASHTAAIGAEVQEHDGSAELAHDTVIAAGSQEPALEAPVLEAAAERASLLGAWSERSLDALRAALESAITGIRSVVASLMERTREQRQRYAIRAAEAKGDRERRLLELTCQRAEAERRSQQLEAARRAAAGYLSELRRESAAAAQQEVVAKSANTSRSTWAQRTKSSLEHQLEHHTKAIAAAAAAAGLLFAVTLLSFSLRGRTVQSQAPVPARPAQGTVQAVASTHSLAPRPNPAVREPAKKQPIARDPRGQAASRRSSATQSQGNVADDVVVRHFSSPKNLQSRVINGVKHYSDIQN